MVPPMLSRRKKATKKRKKKKMGPTTRRERRGGEGNNRMREATWAWYGMTQTGEYNEPNVYNWMCVSPYLVECNQPLCWWTKTKKKHSAWKELLEIDGLDGDEDEDGGRDGRCGRCGTVSQWYRLIMVTVMASYSVRSRKLERGYIVCREREEARARGREGGCGVESDKVGNEVCSVRNVQIVARDEEME